MESRPDVDGDVGVGGGVTHVVDVEGGEPRQEDDGHQSRYGPGGGEQHYWRRRDEYVDE